MNGYNKVILMGMLGADAELKHTQGGQSFLKMRLATSEQWKDKNGQKQEKTEWHSLIYWTPGADKLLQYLSKGTALHIDGKLRSSSYEDKDGNKRYRTDIVVNELCFAGGKANWGRRNDGPSTPKAAPVAQPQSPDDYGLPNDDDVPF